MKELKDTLTLYAVTDRAWSGKMSLYEQAEAALKGGVSCMQLREKYLSEEDFIKEAKLFKTLCEKYNVPLIINDSVSTALACGADGIHVGQSDMEAAEVRKVVGNGMILGVSAQTVEDALKAEAAGADYLGVGAVFSTSTKKDADNVSLDTLKAICEAVSIPVVAIGGISKDNIHLLKGTGIDGIALVSAIFASDDIEKECSELYRRAKEIK